MPENKSSETFETMDLANLKTDCRFFSGYKPCNKSPGCPDCTEYKARGAEILIIKLGAMGDALRTKSLLPALKRKHPQSWITWLTNPGTQSIVKDPLVDEIQIMQPESILALEGRVFDELYCFDKEKGALALARKLEAKKKFGYAPTDFNTATVWNKGSEYALRMGLSDEFKYRMNTTSHQEVLTMCAELPFRRDEYGLEIPDAARQKATNILKLAGYNPAKKIIGFNTGCGPVFQTKAWTVDGFIETAKALSDRDDYQIFLLGGKKEAAINTQIHDSCQNAGCSNIVDTGTDNSLDVFFAIVDHCDVVLSTDSLAMHVAIALKKHVVAFFGPTCEQEIDLFDRGEKIVTDYGCSPCYLKTCDVRPSCMQAMSSPAVTAAIERQLELVEKGDGVSV